MTDNPMREAFEKWAKAECFDLTAVGGFYSDNETDAAYKAWQAAQSVPVVGEPADLFAREKLAIEYCDQRHIVCNDDIRNLAINAFCAGHAIPAAELASLRENAAEADELRKRAERMQKALSDIAEWTDRYTTPGHPVSTIASAAIAQGKGE